MNTKQITSRLNKLCSDEKETIVEVTFSRQDTANSVARLLDYFRWMGNVGHSSSVHIGDSDYAEYSSYFDGDGSDRILDIKIDGQDIEKYFEKQLKDSIWEPEESEWLLSSGFIYNYDGNDYNSFIITDREAYEIRIEKSNEEFEKREKTGDYNYFISILKFGKSLKLRDTESSSVNDFLTYKDFENVKKFIEPFLERNESNDPEDSWVSLKDEELDKLKESDEY